MSASGRLQGALAVFAFVCALTCLAAGQTEAAAPPSDEIIVTGERVARTVKETPSSVAVLDQQQIESAGADRVEQILALFPNVQLGNGSQGPAIRGLDTTGPLSALPAFLGGNRPRMTIIIDGRPVTYNEFVFGSFPLWDVNRIEVFRSPQTTTQGQNSIAGAIFVNTNDPGFSSEYRVRGIIGDYKTRQLSAVASGPIAGDELAFRIAGDFRYSRTTSQIKDVMAGADPNHDVFGLLRGKLLFEPSAGTRMTLIYVHSQSQAPQTVGVSAPFHERRDRMPTYGILRINVDSLSASAHQKLTQSLTADFTVTAGDLQARRLARPHFGETTNDGRDWSVEGIISWSPDARLSAIGGVSRTHAHLSQFIDLSLLSGSEGRFGDWQDGTGLFADSTFRVTDAATVSAGIRYQRDRQERRGTLTANSFVVPVDFVGAFDAWLPKFTFAYDVTPKLRVGAMAEKAYNPGGTTIRVDTSSADNFKAESLWDYELFARAEFGNGRGSIESNLFYYDMRNPQRSQTIIVFTPSGLPVGFANLFNIPKARTYGAEGKLDLPLTRTVSARVAMGLLATKVVRTDAESADLEGKEFDRSPHFTGSAAFDWRPTDRAIVSLQARHHGSYFTNPENDPDLRVGSATIIDGRAEYRFKRLSVFAQVHNILDTFAMRDFFSVIAGEAEDPRTFSIGAEARF